MRVKFPLFTLLTPLMIVEQRMFHCEVRVRACVRACWKEKGKLHWNDDPMIPWGYICLSLTGLL